MAEVRVRFVFRNEKGSGNICGVNCGDVGVPGEVLDVEGQDPGDTMHVHNGHKVGIMRILAGNTVRENQARPFLEDKSFFGHEGEQPLESGEVLLPQFQPPTPSRFHL